MYLIDMLAISPQESWNGKAYLNNIRIVSGNKLMAIEPDYGDIIKPSQLRRMGKALRMGIGCGAELMKRNEELDGIIIGTSEGGLEGCISFLNQIVDYDEGTLTPTNFVQSTPNAVAGQLALISGNSGYNITHVNGGLSFENALTDALMFFAEGKAERLLVGNVEEISDYNFNIGYLAGLYKGEDSLSSGLIGSATPGTLAGEGSAMFVFGRSKQPDSLRLVDVACISYPTKEELSELICRTLEGKGVLAADIDAVIAGYSGDSRSDFWYDDITNELFPGASVYTYKNLVGEYPSSSAFALKLGFDLLRGESVPAEIVKKETGRPLRNVLIYNHYRAKQHSLILISGDFSPYKDTSP